mmetsp:Transcript_20938/g.49735  ORF Transcript_20938/g.49735 Transcript_20938/m.49735 type:complete len:448 (-) Transcript_20938:207-1550(-)
MSTSSSSSFSSLSSSSSSSSLSSASPLAKCDSDFRPCSLALASRAPLASSCSSASNSPVSGKCSASATSKACNASVRVSASQLFRPFTALRTFRDAFWLACSFSSSPSSSSFASISSPSGSSTVRLAASFSSSSESARLWLEYSSSLRSSSATSSSCFFCSSSSIALEDLLSSCKASTWVAIFWVCCCRVARLLESDSCSSPNCRLNSSVSLTTFSILPWISCSCFLSSAIFSLYRRCSSIMSLLVWSSWPFSSLCCFFRLSASWRRDSAWSLSSAWEASSWLCSCCCSSWSSDSCRWRSSSSFSTRVARSDSIAASFCLPISADSVSKPFICTCKLSALISAFSSCRLARLSLFNFSRISFWDFPLSLAFTFSVGSSSSSLSSSSSSSSSFLSSSSSCSSSSSSSSSSSFFPFLLRDLSFASPFLPFSSPCRGFFLLSCSEESLSS